MHRSFAALVNGDRVKRGTYRFRMRILSLFIRRARKTQTLSTN